MNDIIEFLLPEIGREFAKISYENVKIQIVIVDAGLSYGHINWNHSAEEIWYAVLKDAYHKAKLDIIIDTFGENYTSTQHFWRAKFFCLVGKSGVDEKTIKQMYRQSITQKHITYLPTTRKILLDLWDCAVPLQGHDPVIAFVEQLARETPHDTISNYLRLWSEEVIHHEIRTCSATQLDVLRRELQARHDKLSQATISPVVTTAITAGITPNKLEKIDAEIGEETEHYKTLLHRHKQNLRKLELNAAHYESGAYPLSLLNQIEAEKQQITDIQTKIIKLSSNPIVNNFVGMPTGMASLNIKISYPGGNEIPPTKPSEMLKSRYHVDIEFRPYNSSIGQKCYKSGDRGISLNDLKPVLHQIIEKHSFEWREYNLILEVFLPNELLCLWPTNSALHIQRWANPAAETCDTPYGVDYPIIFHLSQRSNNSVGYTHWISRWNLLKQLPDTVDIHHEAHTQWHISKKISKEEQQKLRSQWRLDNDIVCIGLGFAPTQKQLEAILAPILDSGIPIVILPRRCKQFQRSEHDICETIKAIVENAPLSTLYQTLQIAQLKALSGQTHFDAAHNIILLWDAPSCHHSMTDVSRFQAPYSN
ncbi:MAG: hypothetical protein AAF639_45365 [Chloroflexota bacterium]